MLKFKFLLWALAKLLQRAIKNNPACARYVENKELVFQIQTIGGIGRQFHIKNGVLNSSAGLAKTPKFTMTFSDAANGFATLSAKDSKEAFLAALHKEKLVISGDFVEVMWFQGLTDYLQPKKKQKSAPNSGSSGSKFNFGPDSSTHRGASDHHGSLPPPQSPLSKT